MASKMAYCKQLKLLLWKNFRQRSRQPVRVIVELLWPLVLFLILTAVKLDQGLQEHVGECHFDGKAMPSAGLLPFFQGVLCTSRNTCFNTSTPDELPGRVQQFDNSLFSELLYDIETVLSNYSEVNGLTELLEDIDTILELSTDRPNCSFEVSSILLNPSNIQEKVVSQNLSVSPLVITEVLAASVNFSELSQLLLEGEEPVNGEPLTIFWLLGAQNLEQLSQNTQTELCQKEHPERLLIMKHYENSTHVLQQLCNLTAAQFQLLLQDFADEVDYFALVQQVERCTQEQLGKELNEDRNSTTSRQRILQEIQALQSLESLIQELNMTLNDLGLSANSTDSTEMLSVLFCGRRDGVLQAVSESEETLKQVADTTEGDSEHPYIYDNTTTMFCNDVFRELHKTQASRILWKQFKPMIRGKLTFTPNTEAVHRIIKESNSSMESLALVEQLAEDWISSLSPQLHRLIDNSSDGRVNQLRALIRLYASTDPSLQVYSDWLSEDSAASYTWHDTLRQLDILMEALRNYLQCFEFDKFEAFDTETELIHKSLHYIENDMLWAGLVFDMGESNHDDGTTLPSHISVRIRMSVDRVDTTYKAAVTDRVWTPGPRAAPLPDMKYIVYGFAYIQDMVEHAIVRLQTAINPDIGIFVQQFPYPCYIYDEFVRYIARSMPLFMTLAWIYTVSMIVKGVVYEKEQRLKEVMKVMGLGNSIHWLAWFITCFLTMLASVLLLLLVLKTGTVLQHSDGSVILVFLLVFAVSTISQCFMFSVFFNKANLAAACAGIFYFIGYLPYALCARWEELMTTGQKVFASLSSTVAFGFGCSYISRYEQQGVGVQWHNIAHSPLVDDDYSMSACIWMMLFDSLIYAVITWYVEAVFPGQYGVPKAWYFFLTKSYWCGHRYRGDTVVGDTAGPDYEMARHSTDRDQFEQEPSTGKVGVSVRSLSKVYKRGKKVAVDNLNVNFYEGQITSFLGHNGAGKTTTMSILTGLFPPTSGTAYVYGKDIRSDMDSIRHDMGMCPQHNVLFDILTVSEHIWFYASLKGMPADEIDAEMKQLLVDVGLVHKRHTVVKKLSGGMKRKLSVAVAFVANSKVVILDEPTAGVDPYARRSIWDLLLRYRQGRTIILSTHFMDEADVLGDRIAILSEGKLCCSGSSLFLKSRFGSGYYLTMAKSLNLSRKDSLESAVASAPSQLSMDTVTVQVDKTDTGDDVKDEGVSDVDTGSDATSSISDNCEPHVTAFLKKLLPDCKLVQDIGTELSYQLPDDKTHTASYEELFDKLDQNLPALGVASYGISDTSLEEVFLQVTRQSEEVTEEQERQRVEDLTEGGMFARPVTRWSFRGRRRQLFGGSGNRLGDQRGLLDQDDVSYNGSQSDCDVMSAANGTAAGDCNGCGRARVDGRLLVRHQFWALLVKRFHYVRRSKKGFLSQVVLPAIFICLAMIFSMINPPMPQQPPLELHPWHLLSQKVDDSHLYMFYSNDGPSAELADKLQSVLLGQPGVGNRCLQPEVYTIAGYPCLQDELNASLWTETPSKVSWDSLPQCSCDTGYQVCPEGAGGPEPARSLLSSGDLLYNMTDSDIPEWLVRTMHDYTLKRYGGLSFIEENTLVGNNFSEIDEALERLLVAANGGQDHNLNASVSPFFRDLEQLLPRLALRHNAKVWFNNKGYVSMVSYMNIMNNILLRSHLSEGQDTRQYGVSVFNHPMNRTRDQLSTYTLYANAVDVLIAISVIFAMSFIPASFVLFLIEERVSKSKHLQFVSGVNPTVYWLANFFWDMINYTIPCILCILLFVAFQQDSYVSSDNAPCLIALLLLYGWAVTPMMYPASYIFNVPSSAFVGLSCLNVFLGFVSTISTFVLELFMEEDLTRINDVLRQVFLLLPHYCLGRGLIDMTRNQLTADVFAVFDEDVFRSPFEWTLVGRNLFALVMHGFFFFFLNLAIQYKFCSSKWPQCQKSAPASQHSVQNTASVDRDVVQEMNRVKFGDTGTDILTLEGLTKMYKEHKAVDNLYLGVHKGECFGLLGVNGAGKTTTFRMLTGDCSVSSGDAHLKGFSILTDQVSVHQNIGYCPQFDALCPLMTGREHLVFYARLRGVPEEDIDMVATWAIRKLGLLPYADKISADYSGGNRRKLSTAIALVGNPPVIFLDEPTTGMDPAARRFLWKCISEILTDGRSVILTSHSMEECEALCGRIAIMVNGTFQCLGSIQHIKNRFGEGYTLILRIAGQTPDLSDIMQFISETFPGAEQQEQHHNMLQYQLPTSQSLARIFGHMESVRESFNIEDYSVRQTTLDQVFINFAKKQSDDLEDEVRAETVHFANPAASSSC